MTLQYQEIITGSFYGHIHKDELRFISDFSGDSKIIGFYLVGPSISPVFDNNPGFHVFNYDAPTTVLLDFETYYLDLAEANMLVGS